MKKVLFTSCIALLCFGGAYSQVSDKIAVIDTRSVNDLPTAFSKEVRFHFKYNSTINAPGSPGWYSGLMTFAPWGDNSGGKSHQLNFNEQGLYWRMGQPESSSWEAWKRIITADQNGNVGIGIETPAAPLEVYLSSALPTALGSKQLLTRTASGGANYYQNNLWIYRDDNSNTLAWWNVRMHDAISIDGSYQTPGTDTRTWWERDPMEDIQSWGNTNQTYVTINQGNVGIGTTDPKGYKLAVAGKAIAEEVVVKLQTSWPDYVFENNYKLPSLSELEQFIITNKHLPDVPTADEVKENGLSLGEMNAILLKKVEVLTLYLLEQNKTLQGQQEQINKLIEQNKLLYNHITKKQ